LRRTEAWVVAIAAAFLAVVLVSFFGVRREGEAPRRAPVFELDDLSGKKVSLPKETGHVALVNFWATWCPPCVAETPSLEQLSRALGPRGLRVLGVSVDDSVEDVRRFVAEHGVTYTVLLDPSARVSRRYGTFKYPESYLVAADGAVLRKYVGEVDWADPTVRAEIEATLGR
jgi:cytochrome c biogenesis protein CcmG/thiol:disulfide interchange protein DsbE